MNEDLADRAAPLERVHRPRCGEALGEDDAPGDRIGAAAWRRAPRPAFRRTTTCPRRSCDGTWTTSPVTSAPSVERENAGVRDAIGSAVVAAAGLPSAAARSGTARARGPSRECRARSGGRRGTRAAARSSAVPDSRVSVANRSSSRRVSSSETALARASLERFVRVQLCHGFAELGSLALSARLRPATPRSAQELARCFRKNSIILE